MNADLPNTSYTRTEAWALALKTMSPDFYRKEAERLRRLAENQTDPELARKLRQMAEENDALAAELDQSSPS